MRQNYAFILGGVLALLHTSLACRHPAQICATQGGFCALLNTSEVLCWGNNPPGLGYSTTTLGNSPSDVGDGAPLVMVDAPRQIYCGLRHVCVWGHDNYLRCFGLSSNGRLGSGATVTNVGSGPNQMGSNLTQFQTGNNTIVDVFLGPVQTCVRLNDTTVRCVGANTHRLLMANTSMPCIGTTNATLNEHLPVVRAPDPNVSIVKGWFSTTASCWLLDNGKLTCAGSNLHGQHGHADLNISWSDQTPPYVDMGTNQTVLDVCMGSLHTCVLRSNGTRSVVCFGNNANGQLARGSTASYFLLANQTGDDWEPIVFGTTATPRRVFCADTQTCVLFDDGSAKCWGSNAVGRFGYGTLRSTYGTQPSNSGENTPFVQVNGSAIVDIALGGSNCFLLNTSRLVCFGRGTEGQLFVGDSGSRGFTERHINQWILPARFDACAPADPLHQQFAATAVSSSSSSLCPTPESDTIMELNGRTSTGVCARMRSGTLKCWGSNTQGLLLQNNASTVYGLSPNTMGGNLPEPNLGTSWSVRALGSSGSSICAVFQSSSMKCWGTNVYGNLLLGDTQTRGLSANTTGTNLPFVNLLGSFVSNVTIVGLAKTWGNFMCAWLSDGSAKCWGISSAHQTGYTVEKLAWGDDPSELGDQLPFHRFDGQAVQFIEGGVFHGCAILSSRRLVCWGQNTVGALGYGTGNWSLNSSRFVAIPNNQTVMDMCATSDGTCVLTTEGRQVFCWGSNTHGQAGLGTTTHPIFAIDTPVNLGQDAGIVTDIECGAAYVCALFQTGQVKCWGSVPGLGGTNLALTSIRGIAPSQMGNRLETLNLGRNQQVRKLFTYPAFLCALMGNWDLKCWGSSNTGSLGAGNITSFGVVEIESMGDNLPSVDLGLPAPSCVADTDSAGDPEHQSTHDAENERVWIGAVASSVLLVFWIAVAVSLI